jgi:hypothetical protein
VKPSSARIVTETLKNNEVRFITVLPDGWMFEVYEMISKEPTELDPHLKPCTPNIMEAYQALMKTWHLSHDENRPEMRAWFL